MGIISIQILITQIAKNTFKLIFYYLNDPNKLFELIRYIVIRVKFLLQRIFLILLANILHGMVIAAEIVKR